MQYSSSLYYKASVGASGKTTLKFYSVDPSCSDAALAGTYTEMAGDASCTAPASSVGFVLPVRFARYGGAVVTSGAASTAMAFLAGLVAIVAALASF